MTEEELEKQVLQLVGEASACWSNLAGAGVFEAEKARDVARRLLALTRQYARQEATRAIANIHGGTLKTKETHPEEFHEDGYPIEEMGS